jgi:hypothetical protein
MPRARDFLDEKVRDDLIYQSKDAEYRVWGGFFCISSNVICFQTADEQMNTDGEWEDIPRASSSLELLEAKMTEKELEEIIRHASHPWNKEWRLVRLRWEPTIIVQNTSVGLDGARMLLKQHQNAIIGAEFMGMCQQQAAETAS